MILSKYVVRLYSVLLEIGLWVTLLAGFFSGWAAAGFLGAIGGLISAALFGAMIFGAFLVFNEMRKDMRRLVELEEKRNFNNVD